MRSSECFSRGIIPRYKVTKKIPHICKFFGAFFRVFFSGFLVWGGKAAMGACGRQSRQRTGKAGRGRQSRQRAGKAGRGRQSRQLLHGAYFVAALLLSSSRCSRFFRSLLLDVATSTLYIYIDKITIHTACVRATARRICLGNGVRFFYVCGWQGRGRLRS